MLHCDFFPLLKGLSQYMPSRTVTRQRNENINANQAIGAKIH